MKCITSNLKTLENMIISDVMLAIKRLPNIFNDWIHYILRPFLVSCLSIGILLFFASNFHILQYQTHLVSLCYLSPSLSLPFSLSCLLSPLSVSLFLSLSLSIITYFHCTLCLYLSVCFSFDASFLSFLSHFLFRNPPPPHTHTPLKKKKTRPSVTHTHTRAFCSTTKTHARQNLLNHAFSMGFIVYSVRTDLSTAQLL